MNHFIKLSNASHWLKNVLVVKKQFSSHFLTDGVVVLDNGSCICACHCRAFNQYNNSNKHTAESPEVIISESEPVSVSCSDGMQGENVM